MSQIDVSEVLTDPDFVSRVTLIQRSASVNGYGKNEIKETGIATFGCVQPASGKTLQRLPEALRVVDVQSFWVKGKIIADGACKYPDIIVSKGVRYTIQVVFDWSQWGQGWCEGTCVREKPAL